VGHIARIGKMRNTYQELDENTEGKRKLSKTYMYLRNNITTHSKEANFAIMGSEYQAYGNVHVFQRHASE
jgi:hypothetical protein